MACPKTLRPSQRSDTRLRPRCGRAFAPLFRRLGSRSWSPAIWAARATSWSALASSDLVQLLPRSGPREEPHPIDESWSGRRSYPAYEIQGVQVMATSKRTIAEEMPDAYKNVDKVVEAVQEAGLAKMVARLKPALVIKG